MAFPDLITADELLAALGKNPADLDYENIQRYEFAVKSTSAAIRNYTGRSFELATGIPTLRTFEYDGSGFLDINDAQSVVSVTGQDGVSSRTLLADEYTAQPIGSQWPVFEWIQVLGGVWGVGSPEMGFERNLDKLYSNFSGRPVLMEVSANWGWAEIPYDVRQAVVWVAAALSEDTSTYQSESIEGYSRSHGQMVPNQVITERAMAALAPYEKQKV